MDSRTTPEEDSCSSRIGYTGCNRTLISRLVPSTLAAGWENHRAISKTRTSELSVLVRELRLDAA